MRSESHMLQAARHQAILEMVQKERIVKVSDLADALKVSAMTVRRDIEALSDTGLLERIHGGAKILGDAGTHEPGFELKSTQFTAEKQAIAAVAAGSVSEGMAVGLSAGTTTWALAQELVKGPAITVVTNSIRTAEIFYRSTIVNAKTEVILIGGQRTASDALVGPVATQALKSMNLDVTFLGVHGMDPQAGFSPPWRTSGLRFNDGPRVPGVQPQTRRGGRPFQVGNTGHQQYRGAGRRGRAGDGPWAGSEGSGDPRRKRPPSAHRTPRAGHLTHPPRNREVTGDASKHSL